MPIATEDRVAVQAHRPVAICAAASNHVSLAESTRRGCRVATRWHRVAGSHTRRPQRQYRGSKLSPGCPRITRAGQIQKDGGYAGRQ